MPGLFGITHSNRRANSFWTKNNFNSSFPAALANYMFANGIPVNYIVIDQNLQSHIVELPVNQLYNMGNRQLDDLFFAFETVYSPYSEYLYERLDRIDLVIKSDNEFLRPLEVKLTVIPDSATKSIRDEASWGSEIVFRSATTQYCNLGMTHSLFPDHREEIRNLFEPLGSRIDHWDSTNVVRPLLDEILSVDKQFCERFYAFQQPLIMQPIWKTQGQSPLLVEEGTFDIFVWSDFAYTQLFLTSPPAVEDGRAVMSRHNRAAVRFFKYWFDVAIAGRVHWESIYRNMTFQLQNDKEFSVNGHVTNPYMRSPRLTHPAINRSALYDIILDGGETRLMPERRLDQTVLYYTTHNPRPI